MLRRQRPSAEVRLLPAFDQYVLAAARDIEHLVPAAHRKGVFRTINGWIAATVVLDSRVVGAWSLEKGEVRTDLWQRVPKAALSQEIERVERLAAATVRRRGGRLRARTWGPRAVR